MAHWLVVRDADKTVIYSKSLRGAQEFEAERAQLEEVYPYDISLEWLPPGETPK